MGVELFVGLLALVVIWAGVASIVGALKRTAARPAHDARNSGDGGPIYGHHDHDGDGGGD